MSAVEPAALITGSSRSIGLGIAVELAKRGFNVALNARSDGEELDAAAEAVAEHGVRVVKVPGDVSDLGKRAPILDRTEAEIGPLSTLVNNAGVSVMRRGDMLEVSEESYDCCMAVNAKALFFLGQAFARRLVDRSRDDGRFYSLINVTSSNAVAASAPRAEYCTSKAAAAMISRTFAVRLGEEGIAVYDV